MIQLSADFSKKLRPMGKQNGMNNGPLFSYVDMTDHYKAMGVDFVRFHETQAMLTNAIEVPFVFPDFDADEYDEKNYRFEHTDVVMEYAVKSGMEIMYRFGMGTEVGDHRLFCVVPPDYEKWGRIVIQILKHYNEGWANGFHYSIKWCEIWNEADLKQYWPGPHEEYTKFYCVVSRMLKAYDPTLRVGPSGFAGSVPVLDPEQDPVSYKNAHYTRDTLIARCHFYHDFLQTVHDEQVPMDFFAWHCYVYDSASCVEKLQRHINALEAHGLKGVEIINTEWGPVTLKSFGVPKGLEGQWGGGWDMAQTETFKSAICCLASMIVMQNLGNTKAAYYDPDPRSDFCGLFDHDGTIWNHFYSMKAFSMLRAGEWEYETTGQTDKVRICASYNGKKAYVCVTSEDEAHEVQLKVENLGKAAVTWYLFDEQHPLKRMKKSICSGKPIKLSMPAHSAWVLEFDPE